MTINALKFSQKAFFSGSLQCLAGKFLVLIPCEYCTTANARARDLQGYLITNQNTFIHVPAGLTIMKDAQRKSEKKKTNGTVSDGRVVRVSMLEGDDVSNALTKPDGVLEEKVSEISGQNEDTQSEPETWSCPACTFKNHRDAKQCQVCGASEGPINASHSKVQGFVMMGFDQQEVTKALEMSNGDEDTALELLLSGSLK